jgi:Ion channel
LAAGITTILGAAILYYIRLPDSLIVNVRIPASTAASRGQVRGTLIEALRIKDAATCTVDKASAIYFDGSRTVFSVSCDLGGVSIASVDPNDAMLLEAEGLRLENESIVLRKSAYIDLDPGIQCPQFSYSKEYSAAFEKSFRRLKVKEVGTSLGSAEEIPGYLSFKPISCASETDYLRRVDRLRDHLRTANGLIVRDGLFDWDAFGNCVYFSFTAITTLGFGDIAPAATLSRGIAVIEAAIGILLFGALVSGLLPDPSPEDPETENAAQD